MRTRIICVVDAEPLKLEGWEELNLCLNKDPLNNLMWNVTERWTGMQIARARTQLEAEQMAIRVLATHEKSYWEAKIKLYRMPQVIEADLNVEPVL